MFTQLGSFSAPKKGKESSGVSVKSGVRLIFGSDVPLDRKSDVVLKYDTAGTVCLSTLRRPLVAMWHYMNKMEVNWLGNVLL